MTHLYIELNTGLTEEVNSSIISKLYELAISGDLDNTSDLKGRLHTTICKDLHYNYLNNNFDELYISADTLSITFEDPDVENAVADYLGTDGNVLLSDIQAFVASGKNFGEGWRDPRTHGDRSWTTIWSTRLTWNSFNELRLFEGVTAIHSNAFNDCIQLTSIQLPTTIKTIKDGAFSGCSSLLHAFLSTSTETVNIDRSSFRGCTNLEFPDEFHVQFATYSRNFMENYRTFDGCTKLKKLVLHGSDINLGYRTFCDCTSLSEIVNSDKISYIGCWCFHNLPSLYGTLDLSGVIDIGRRNTGTDTPGTGMPVVFSTMPNVDKIILGGLDGGMSGGLWNMYADNRSFVYNMSNLVYFDFGILGGTFPNYRDVNNINKGILFRYCPNLTTVIIRNSTVMPLQYDDIVHPYDIGGSGVTLYVPDEIVNDYKTAAGWSNIANQIKGISELPS